MPATRSRTGEELLSIIGLLAALGGVAVVWVIGSIRRPFPSVGRAWMVFILGAVLVIAGIWLVRLRRWAAVLVAMPLTAATRTRSSGTASGRRA